MRAPQLLLPLVLSLAAHVGLFFVGRSSDEARILFSPGEAAVALTILPSVASRAAAPPVERIREERPERVEMPDTAAEPERVEADREPTRPTHDAALAQLLPRQDPTIAARLAAAEPTRQQPHHARPDTDKRATPSPGEAIPHAPAVAAPTLPQDSVATSTAAETPAPQQQPHGADHAEMATVSARETDGDLAERGAASADPQVRACRPRYPLTSRRHGEEGTVVLAVEIRADGQHGRIDILKSSGYPRLDHEAVRAVRRASFLPATRAAVAVASTKRVAIEFRLRDPHD